ncbi:interleukin-18 receptor accessory protein-like [Parambassis ranga]|uniref:Interleukin-18 receptor accessory protein-like n=1 Tax=Parambassis ranga TaxID=210632 RepID=A0A6P7I0M0_9TELE|nr:interleukin-18 receptor accessory protein-like [Parambassis ranga]
MQTRCVLFFLIFPILLEGCCKTHHQRRRTVFQRETTDQHYRVVEGESFMMPCVASLWFRTTEGVELKDSSLDCGKVFQAQLNHSGKYTSSQLSSGHHVVIYLQVVEKNALGCFQAEEHSVTLRVAAGGQITCPGFNCSNNTNVIWYKSNKLVSEQRRALCEKRGRLHLCQVTEYDEDVYFCDRQIVVQGVTWTFRRAVQVKIVRYHTSSDPPRIEYPDVNMTEEVELGQPHTLTCHVFFQVEEEFSPKVQWYLNHGGNMENMTLLSMERSQEKRVTVEEFEVIQRAIIKEVTPQHLNHTYSCIASTPVHKSSVTIQLKQKIKVKWPVLVGYPIVSFLLIVGLGIILHVKWLELQLIYRSHFQHGKNNEEKKEFDVLLSYVWNPLSEEVVSGFTMSSRPGTFSSEEACFSMDLVNSEDEATQTPLEVLLPQVIEGQWGYRLCLLERDVLPGGAYTNDVVLAIKRSRMLICILSTDYLSDSNAVFVLETGVKALLQNSVPKLLLIWTSRASASLMQPDPPLPALVQRALKVLPSLDWTSRKPAKATSKFWRSLKKAMPNH